MNITLISAAIAGALGFGAAWQVQAWRADAAELARLEAVEQINRENATLAHRGSTGFEKDRSTNETRIRTITVEVDKIIDRPVFRNVCMDADGLQLINAAIRREAPASESGSAVPKPAGTD
ncbi:MAG: hypothetical protein WC829_18960 [Hyphomicrobium sp.]|jgi:hypothetical protein